MRELGLIYHGGKAGGQLLAEEVMRFLRGRGYVLRMAKSNQRDDCFFQNLDLCITLGGDGTLLGVAALAGVPLLGINCGRQESEQHSPLRFDREDRRSPARPLPS